MGNFFLLNADFFDKIGLNQLIIWLTMQILNGVKGVLQLIFDIANISFFSEDVISELATRAYIVIGILMVFKITISCIQYLVNPDKVEDKENGFGGIIKRTIISVLLLALVPTLFDFAKTSQNAIAEALPKIILGTENESDIGTISEKIAYTTALSFFGYSEESCNDGSIGGLKNAKGNPTFETTSDIINNVSTITDATCNGHDRYSFQWWFLIPTAGFLLFITLSMVVDVSIRMIKFGFLEIIAPIPIASYIDPKTSKKSFDSWVHSCVSVYIDLFIRLGVIYLIIYLFELILTSFDFNFTLNDGTVLPWYRSMLVNIAIIISLFTFAKNAPKFICDVLGIKDSGGLTDMFKRAGGFGMAPITGLRSSVNSYRSARDYGEGRIKSLRRAMGGATGGILRTAAGAVGGKKPMDAYRSGFDKTKTATNKKLEYANRYPKFKERVGRKMTEAWDQFSGITTAGEKANVDISAANMGLDTRKYAWERAEAKVLEATGKYDHIRKEVIDSSGNRHAYNVTEMLSRIELLKNDRTKEAYAGEYETLTKNRQAILDEAKIEHIRLALTRASGTDTALANELAERVLKLARSGSNSEFVSKQFLGQFSELFDKLKSGDSSPVLSSADAEAIAKYISGGLNKDAGAARLEALGKQTSVPKGDGK